MLILEIAAGVALAPVVVRVGGWAGYGAVWLCVGPRRATPRPAPNVVNVIGAAWITLCLLGFAAVGFTALLT